MIDFHYLLDYLTFDTNSFNNETVLRVPYQHSVVLPFEKDMFDMLYWRHQFVSKWHFSIVFGLLYIVGIYSLVYVMRDRKPKQLRGSLIVWNGGLALFSLLGMVRTWEEWIHTLENYGFYKSVCYIYPTFSVTGHWFLFFTASKFVELGDTVFLVLRKRPLSFLHCYHHMSVLVITIESGAEQLGPESVYFCPSLSEKEFDRKIKALSVSPYGLRVFKNYQTLLWIQRVAHKNLLKYLPVAAEEYPKDAVQVNFLAAGVKALYDIRVLCFRSSSLVLVLLSFLPKPLAYHLGRSVVESRWFMCMNFGAHAVMYTYYSLVSYGFRFPKWLSATVTTIQIVQLLSGVAISCILLAIKTFTDWPCQQTWLNLGICFFIYISYSALFLQFFKHAYLTKKTTEKVE